MKTTPTHDRPLSSPHNPPAAPPLHPVESGSDTATTTTAAKTSLALLLSRHILRDGELVLLILKPSLWFVVLASLRFAAVVLILMSAAIILADERHALRYLETAIFFIAGRVGWAVLQWMGRMYILTDLRVVALSGVFNIEIFDCPLRRVARTRLARPLRERLLRLGTVEITPADESAPAGAWQTIPRPVETHDQIVAAINRAKHTGFGCPHAA